MFLARILLLTAIALLFADLTSSGNVDSTSLILKTSNLFGFNREKSFSSIEGGEDEDSVDRCLSSSSSMKLDSEIDFKGEFQSLEPDFFDTSSLHRATSLLKEQSSVAELLTSAKKLLGKFLLYWRVYKDKCEPYNFTSSTYFATFKMILETQEWNPLHNMIQQYPKVYNDFKTKRFLPEYVLVNIERHCPSTLLNVFVNIPTKPVNLQLDSALGGLSRQRFYRDLKTLDAIALKYPVRDAVLGFASIYSVLSAYTFIPIMLEFQEAIEEFNLEQGRLVSDGADHSGLKLNSRLAVDGLPLRTASQLKSLFNFEPLPLKPASCYHVESYLASHTIRHLYEQLPLSARPHLCIYWWINLGFLYVFNSFVTDKVHMFSECLMHDVDLVNSENFSDVHTQTAVAKFYLRALTSSDVSPVTYLTYALLNVQTNYLNEWVRMLLLSGNDSYALTVMILEVGQSIEATSAVKRQVANLLRSLHARKFPRRRHAGKMTKYQERCSICLANLNSTGNKDVANVGLGPNTCTLNDLSIDALDVLHSTYTTRCGHSFHSHCLSRWIERFYKSPVPCPICRQSL